MLACLPNRSCPPALGRFLSRDPILAPVQLQGTVGWLLPYLNLDESPQALHPYLYVKNNPVNSADPLGLLDPIFLPGIYPTPAVPPTVPSVCKGAWAPSPRTSCKMACGALGATWIGGCSLLTGGQMWACRILGGAATAACMAACDNLPAVY